MDRPSRDIQDRLANVRLVLMDIDGTLTTSDKATFDNVVQQLKRLKPLNIRFSIATGRTISGSMQVVEDLRKVGMRMPPIINYNGGVVLSGSDFSVIDRHVIARSSFHEVIKYCRQNHLAAIAYTCQERPGKLPFETAYVELVTLPTQEFNGMSVEIVDDLLALDLEFVAVLIETPNSLSSIAMVDAIGASFGTEVRVSTSGGKYVEICHPKGTKLQAMKTLGQLYHIGVHQIMAIGDNLNDLDMIKNAGVGVAVANAPEIVKAEANLVCSRSSAQGVVEALRLLVRVVRHGHSTPTEV